METFNIKEEPMDTCFNYETNHEFECKPLTIKSEEDPDYGFFLNEPKEYKFYIDDYNEKKLLNNIIMQELSINIKEEAAGKESEDEDFELRLSDTSGKEDGEDEARNESISDLCAVSNKLKFRKIHETPCESNTRPEKIPSKFVKNELEKTPKRKNTMKQTSLLPFLKLNLSASVERNKTRRSRKSSNVDLATSIIDPVEMRKIKSAKVVLGRLPDIGKFIKQHCAKCKKDYSNLVITSNIRCVRCSEAIVFRCSECNKIYCSQSSVRYHLGSQCLLRNEFKCSQCEFLSTSKDALHKHEKSEHKSKVKGAVKCEKCEKYFLNSSNLKRHQMLNCSKKDGQREAIGIESLVQSYCTSCENSVAKSRYTRKCSKCKVMLSFQCTRCHLVFATKKEAQNHAKIHQE